MCIPIQEQPAVASAPTQNPVGFFFQGRQLPVDWHADHRFSMHCPIESPGVYQLHIDLDLTTFDWDRLWLAMHANGNDGRRTGPWDFDPWRGNVPVLPAWRVWFNEELQGVFYAPRPSIEDMASRTITCTIGFEAQTAGPFQITASPCDRWNLRPIAIRLEPDSSNPCTSPPWINRGLQANWAYQFHQQEKWQDLADRVRHGDWRRLLLAARTDILAHGNDEFTDRYIPEASAIPTLLFAHHLLDHDTHTTQAINDFVNAWMQRKAWSTAQSVEQYGYNGDMSAAHILLAMALIYNWFADDLSSCLDALQQRLIHQLDAFLDQQLLQATRWGGGLLNDHARRSSCCFTTAALAMLGHTDRAQRWLAFAVDRMRRATEAMPHDGGLPAHCRSLLENYVNHAVETHLALRFATGKGLLEHEAYQHIPRFIRASMDQPSMSYHQCSTECDRLELVGGMSFFLALASEQQHAQAGQLANLLFDRLRQNDFQYPPTVHRLQRRRAYESVWTALLYTDGLNPPSASPTQESRITPLNYFPDTSRICYHDLPTRLHVTADCEVPGGVMHRLLQTNDLANDATMHNPSAGAFSVAVGREPLIQNAEGGYRSASQLSNVLLIDGQGQYGDCGYPMSVPIRTWQGQRIDVFQPNETGDRGMARMQLGPAYPEMLGVLRYERTFEFAPDTLRVRDVVVCRDPHQFSYHFHTYRRHRLESLASNLFLFAHEDEAVTLEIIGEGFTTHMGETDVVYAYVTKNEDPYFKHVQILSEKPCRAFTLTFVIRADNQASARNPTGER